jgi:hypothetical protein
MIFHPVREGLHDFSSIKVNPKGQESAHSQNKSGPTFWDYPQLGGWGPTTQGAHKSTCTDTYGTLPFEYGLGLSILVELILNQYLTVVLNLDSETLI